MSKFRNNPRFEAFMSIVVFAIISIVFGIYLVHQVKSIRQSYAALNWVTCPLTKVEETYRTTYYHYVYQGKSYQTTTWGQGVFSPEKNLSSLKHKPVYVNPLDPAEAVISPGVGIGAWAFLGVFSLLAIGLFSGMVVCTRYYVRHYAGKPRSSAKKVRRADSTGSRKCKWDRYTTLDELLNSMQSPHYKDDPMLIENIHDKTDSVEIIVLEDKNFQLCTGEDAEWIDTVASPTMSREDVVLWMEAYQLGVPMSTLTKGWEEL